MITDLKQEEDGKFYVDGETREHAIKAVKEKYGDVTLLEEPAYVVDKDNIIISDQEGYDNCSEHYISFRFIDKFGAKTLVKVSLKDFIIY